MYLGLDLGTSGLKALLIDEKMHPIVSATSSLEVDRPHNGWSEQNPDHWIKSCISALDEIASTHPKELALVESIGLSGHMHGATILDSSDSVLRPCMLWNDTRSHAEAARLDGKKIFRNEAGNIVFPGFTAPKVEWVRNNEPENFEQIAKILLPKDYLRLWLTGEHVSDMSDAAGTAWLNVKKRDWSDNLLSECYLDRTQMPRLVEGTEISGTLRKKLSERWGMGQSVVVAGGGGDNAASAVGIGAVSSGEAFVSLGTSGVLFAANDAYQPKPESAVHTFCHALPNTWHQMGVILSATDSLNWFADLTGEKPSDLTNNLGELKPPSEVTFLPYLSGERTPHNDASIRGGFVGLAHSHDRPELTRAVLEGVAFAFRDNLEALQSTGTVVDKAIAVGGGSQSIYWLNTIATALNIEVQVPVGGDFGAALGAARLGMIASTGAEFTEVCTQPEIETSIKPNKDLQNTFEDGYNRYKAAYPAFKQI